MKNTNVEIQHFTNLLRLFHLPPSNKLPYRDTKLTFCKYSATQLREAGVTFKVASSKCALNLDFQNGMLKIQQLKFQDTTEALIYEQQRSEWVPLAHSILGRDDRLLIANRGCRATIPTLHQ